MSFKGRDELIKALGEFSEAVFKTFEENQGLSEEVTDVCVTAQIKHPNGKEYDLKVCVAGKGYFEEEDDEEEEELDEENDSRLEIAINNLNPVASGLFGGFYIDGDD